MALWHSVVCTLLVYCLRSAVYLLYVVICGVYVSAAGSEFYQFYSAYVKQNQIKNNQLGMVNCTIRYTLVRWKRKCPVPSEALYKIK